MKKIIVLLVSTILCACAVQQKVDYDGLANSADELGYQLAQSGDILIDKVEIVRLEVFDGAPPAPGSIPYENNAYFLSYTKWDTNTIYVCWENPDEKYQKDMEIVRQAALNTWERYSALEFVGWGQCQSNSVGIRIMIEDSGPHVKGLGSSLDGIKNGMVLNFDYSNWSQSCKASEEMKNSCTYSIAVHEFGHAIGFAHEQNRPDTPGECALRRQGTDGDLVLTSWDLQSVMNYCNPTYNNNGELSEGDKFAVNHVYPLER